MSTSWKQLGTTSNTNNLTNVVFNSVVTDSLIVKDKFLVQDLDINGSVAVYQSIDICNNLITYGNIYGYTSLYISEDISLNNNLYISQDAYVNNKLYFGTTDANPGNYSYFYGNSIAGNFGINTMSPQTVFDITGDVSNILTVRTSGSSIRNIIAQNNSYNGITVSANLGTSSIGFFPNNDISLNLPISTITALGNSLVASSVNTVIRSTNVTELYSVNYTKVSSKLCVSNRSAVNNILNETVTIYDISVNPFLYQYFQNTTANSGNALSLVATDSSSTTFLNIVTPNKNGLAIGGGTFVGGDSSRSMGMLGLKDVSGTFTPSQVFVSGKNTSRYLSTTGFNTFYPKTEKYVVDVNGPMRLGNGEINVTNTVNYQIKNTVFCKAFPYFGILLGSPSSTSSPYSQYISITNDGGATWKTSAFQAGTGIEDIPIMLTAYVCDLSNIFVCSQNSDFLYFSNNAGNSWTFFTDIITRTKSFNTIYAINSGNTNTAIITGLLGSVNTIFVYNTITLLNNNLITYDSFDMISTGSFSITASDGSGSIVYFVGNGIQKYDFSNYRNSVSRGLLYTINTSNQYNDVFMFDASNGIAVGSNIISYTRNGTTWLSGTIANFSAPFSLNSVFVYDMLNAVAVGNNGVAIYSINGFSIWNVLPPEIINSSGIQYRINASNKTLTNVFMSDINSVLITDTSNTFINGSGVLPVSSIIYGFFPNLFNRTNNNVLDISGNMNVTGDIMISGNGKLSSTNTSFSLLNENIQTMGLGNSLTTLGIGSSVTKTNILGSVFIGSDVSLGSRLIIVGDVSMVGSRLFVLGDTSFNSAVTISGDLILNSKLMTPNDISFNQRLFVGGDVSLNSNLFIQKNTQIGSKLDVVGDSSLNGILTVGGVASFNQFMYLAGNAYFGSQLSVSDNTYLSSRLNVVGDASLNARLVIGGDASMNSRLLVGGDVSMNSRLLVGGDASFNQNAFVGGNLTVANNFTMLKDFNIVERLFVAKNATFNTNLGVGGDASFNARLVIGGDATFNTRLVVGGDSSLKTRLLVGSDASFDTNVFIRNDLVTNGNVNLNNKLVVTPDEVGVYIPLNVLGDITSDATVSAANLNIVDSNSSVSCMNGSVVIYQPNYPSITFNTSEDPSITNYSFLAFYRDVNSTSIPDAAPFNIFNTYNYFNSGSNSESAFVIGSRKASSNSSSNIVIHSSSSIVLDSANYENRVSTFGSTVLQPRGGSVGVGVVFPQNALDVSGVFTVTGDASLNSRVFVGGEAILNSRLSVGGNTILNLGVVVMRDASFNSRLVVGGNTTLNSGVVIKGDASMNSGLFVGGDASLNSKLFVAKDASFNSRLVVGGNTTLNLGVVVKGDASMNSVLAVGGDASFNSKLFVAKDASFNMRLVVGGNTTLNSGVVVIGDASFNKNISANTIFANSITCAVTFSIPSLRIDTDLSVNNRLFVTNESRLNNRLFVTGDISANSRMSVGGDLSLNGNLSVNSQYINLGNVISIAGTNVANSNTNIVTSRLSVTSNIYNTGVFQTNKLAILDSTSVPIAPYTGTTFLPSSPGSLVIKHSEYPSITLNVEGNNVNFGFMALYKNSNTFIPNSTFKYNYLNNLTSNSAFVLSSQYGAYNSGSDSYMILQPSSALILDSACYTTSTPIYGATIIQPRGGVVGIGRTNPSATLDISGNVAVTGDVSLNSRLFVGSDLVIGGKLTYNSPIFFPNDVSFNGNVIVNSNNVTNTGGYLTCKNVNVLNDLYVYGSIINASQVYSSGVANTNIRLSITTPTTVPSFISNTGITIQHDTGSTSGYFGNGYSNMIFNNAVNPANFGFVSFYDSINTSSSNNTSSVVPLSYSSQFVNKASYNYLNRPATNRNLSAMILGNRYQSLPNTGGCLGAAGENYVILQPDAVIVLDAACYSTPTTVYGVTLIQPRGGNVAIGKNTTLPNYTLDVSGDLFISKTAWLSDIDVGASSTFRGDVTLNGPLTINGSTIFNNNVSLRGNTTFETFLGIFGNITINNDLMVNRNVLIAGNSTINSNFNIVSNVNSNSSLNITQNSKTLNNNLGPSMNSSINLRRNNSNTVTNVVFQAGSENTNVIPYAFLSYYDNVTSPTTIIPYAGTNNGTSFNYNYLSRAYSAANSNSHSAFVIGSRAASSTGAFGVPTSTTTSENYLILNPDAAIVLDAACYNTGAVPAYGVTLIQPRGGQVAIGKNTALYTLDISGNLYLSGNAVFNSQVMFNGNAAFTGSSNSMVNLSLSGNAAIAGNSTVSLNSTIGRNLTVSGNIANMNLVTFGTMNVFGDASFANRVFINNNTSISGNNSVRGNTFLLGNVSVGKLTGAASAMDVSGSLLVSNDTTISNRLNVAGNTTFGYVSVTGDASMQNVDLLGNLKIASNTLMNNNASVLGNTILLGNVSVGKMSGASSAIDVSGNLSVSSDANIGNRLFVTRDVFFSNNAAISGNTSVLGNFGVGKSGIALSTVDVSGNMRVSADVNFGNRLFVMQDALFSANTNVNGNTSVLGRITAGNASVIGSITSDTASFTTQVSTKNAIVSGFASLKDVAVSGNASVVGNIIAGNIAVIGTTAFSDLSLSGNAIVNGNSFLIGNTSLSNANFSGNAAVTGNSFVMGKIGVGTYTPSRTVDISGDLVVSADASFNSRVFISGDVSLNSSVSISKNAIVMGFIGVGKTTPACQLDVSGGFMVSRDASLNRSLYVNNNVLVGGNMNIIGNSVFNGTTSVLGLASFVNSNFDGNVSIALNTYMNNASITGNTYMNKAVVNNITVNNDSIVGGNSFVSGLLGVGTSTPTRALDVAGDMNVSRDSLLNRVFVAGNATVAGTLFVNNISIGSNVSLTYNATNIADLSVNNRLFVVGDASFANRLFVSNEFNTSRLIVSNDAFLNAGVYTPFVTFADGTVFDGNFKNYGVDSFAVTSVYDVSNNGSFTPRTDLGYNSWGAFACSQSNQYQTLCQGADLSVNGFLYTSYKYGAPGSWVQAISDLSRCWSSVCMSKNGQYQYAICTNVTGVFYVFKSENFGNGWISILTPATGNTTSLNNNIVTSADGRQVYFIHSSRYLYYSGDFGNTWTTIFQVPANGNLSKIAISYTGKNISLVNANSIFVSNSYGVNGSWREEIFNTDFIFSSVSLSNSGKYQYVCSLDKWFIVYSSDYGDNWDLVDVNLSVIEPPLSFTNITTSDNGQLVFVSTSSVAFFSSDYANTFTPVCNIAPGSSISSLAIVDQYCHISTSSRDYSSLFYTFKMPITSQSFANAVLTSPVISNATFTNTAAFTFTNDFIINNRLFVVGDVSINRLLVSRDTVLNNRLFVTGDSSLNTLFAGGILANRLNVVRDVSMGNRVFMVGDVSMGSRTFIVGDVSMGSRLFVSGDASFNTNLSVTRDLNASRLIVSKDAVLNAGVSAPFVSFSDGTLLSSVYKNYDLSALLVTSTAAGFNAGSFTSRTELGYNSWGAFAISQNNQYQTICQGSGSSSVAGFIYASSNYGVSGSWIPVVSGVARCWTSVCMSKNGQYQYAICTNVTGSFYVFKSASYGVAGSWTTVLTPVVGNTSSILNNIATSANGQYVYFTHNSGYVYYSGDYGNTWIIALNLGGATTTVKVVVSANGQYVSVASNTTLYTSSSYGTAGSWISSVTINVFNNGFINNIVMSNNGQFQYASVDGGSMLYVSSNYGALGSWSLSTVQPFMFFKQITTSDTGRIVFAATNSIAFVSTNYGISGSFYPVFNMDAGNVISSVTIADQYCHISTANTSYNALFYSMKLPISAQSLSNAILTSPVISNATFTNLTAFNFNNDFVVNNRLFVTGDSSFNRLFVSGELNINRLNVTDISPSRLFVGGDVSFNQLVVAADASLNRLNVMRDASLSRLYVSSVAVSLDASMGRRLFVVGDASMGRRLFVVGDASFNSKLSVIGDANMGFRLFVAGDTNMSSRLFIVGDASVGNKLGVVGDATMGAKLLTVGDASMGSRLFVVGDASMGSRLGVLGDANLGSRLVVTGDANLGSRLFVVGEGFMNSNLFINNDTIAGSRLFVIGDASMGSKFDVVGDATMAARMFVIGDASMGSRLFVVGDASLSNGLFVNGTATMGSSINVIQDTSMCGRTFIGGDASFNSMVTVYGDTSLNSRLFVSQDVSMISDLYVKGNTNIDSNCFVKGVSYVIGNSYVKQDMHLKGNLNVKQNINLLGDIRITGNLFIVGEFRSDVIDYKTYYMNYNVINSGSIYLNNNMVTVLPNRTINDSYSAGVGVVIYDNSNSKSGGIVVSQDNSAYVFYTPQCPNKVRLEIADMSQNGILVLNGSNRYSDSSFNIGVNPFSRFDISNNFYVSKSFGVGLEGTSVSAVLDVSGNSLLRGSLNVLKDLSANRLISYDISLNHNLRVGNSIVFNNSSGFVRYIPDILDFTIPDSNTTYNYTESGVDKSALLIGTNTLSTPEIILHSAANIYIDSAIYSTLGDSFGTTVIQPRGGYVGIGVASPVNALDISGVLSVSNGDALFNSRVFVAGDASFNTNLYVNQNATIQKRADFIGDASMGGRLLVYGDTSMNGRLFMSKDASFNGTVYVNNLVVNNLNNNLGSLTYASLYVERDGSFNGKLLVIGDTSLCNRVFIAGDASMGSRLFIAGDASMNSRLFVAGDASMGSRLFVVGDASMGSRLTVLGNTSFGNVVSVNGDLSLNSRLFHAGDASFNSNVYIQNKLSCYAIDVSTLNVTNLNYQINQSAFAHIDVTNDTTLYSRLFVAGDASFSSNVFVLGNVTTSSIAIYNDLSLGGNFYYNFKPNSIPINAIINTAMDLSSSQVASGDKSFLGNVTTQSTLNPAIIQYNDSTIQTSNYMHLDNDNFATTWNTISALPTGVFPSYTACSTTGQYLLMSTTNGYVYASSRFGIAGSWNTAMNSTTIRSVAICGTGQYQAAGGFVSLGVNRMFVSSNFGVSWNPVFDTSFNISSITFSLTGKYAAFVGIGGFLFYSSNYGASWKQLVISNNPLVDIKRNWSSIAMSANSQYISATVSEGSLISQEYIYTSSNFGASWTIHTAVPNYWTYIAMSATGQYQTAVCSPGFVYASANYGASGSWTPVISSSLPWTSVAMSATGQLQVASSSPGAIYYSANFGIAGSWVLNTFTNNLFWKSVSMSPNSQYIFAVTSDNNMLYSSVTPFYNMSITNCSFKNDILFNRFFVLNDSSLNGNLVVTGNSVLGSLATVKDTSLGSRLFVWGNAFLNSGLSVSGDLSLNARLVVGGDSIVGGNSVVGMDLSVSQNIHGSGLSTLNRLIVSNDASVHRLFVADSSFQNLNVTSSTSLNALAVSADANFNTRLFASQSVVNYLNVSSAANLQSLYVSGDASLNTLYVSGGDGGVFYSPLSVFSDVSFNTRLFVYGNTYFGGNSVVVGGNAVVNSTLSVLGDVSCNANLAVGAKLFVNGLASFYRDASMGSRLNVGGDSTMSSRLSVVGDSAMGSRLNVVGDVSMGTRLNVGGDVSMLSRLFVVGDSAMGRLVINDTITCSRLIVVGGDASMNSRLIVAGDSLMSSRLIVGGDSFMGSRLFVGGSSNMSSLFVSADLSSSRLFTVGDSTMGARLNVVGDSAMAARLNVVGDSVLGARLNVVGEATIGSRLNVLGDSVLGARFNVLGDAVLRSKLNVLGDSVLGARLNVLGDSVLGGGMVVNGDISMNGFLYANFKDNTIPSSAIMDHLSVYNNQLIQGDKSFTEFINSSAIACADGSLFSSAVSNVENSLFAKNWVAGTALSYSNISNAISDTGKFMCIGTLNGPLLSSSDFGKSWVSTITNILTWSSVAISQNGKYQLAFALSSGKFANLYLSNAFGVSGSWAPVSIPSITQTIDNTVYTAISGTGKYMCVSFLNYFFFSSDFGASWTNTLANLVNTTISTCNMSHDGKYVVVCSATTLYLSNNYGAIGSWVPLNIVSSTIANVALSSNGKYMSLVLTSGRIWVTFNFGATWNAVTTFNDNFTHISVSATGQYQCAISLYNKIYINANFGALNSWILLSNIYISNSYSAIGTLTSNAFFLSSGTTSSNNCVSISANGKYLLFTPAITSIGYAFNSYHISVLPDALTNIGYGGIKSYGDIQTFGNIVINKSLSVGGDISFNNSNVFISGNLRVSQNIQAQAFYYISDKRVKRNVRSIDASVALDMLRNIQPRSFDFIENSVSTVGFIAQEVRDVFPDAVYCSQSFIPNIYQFASVSGALLSIQSSACISVGDKIRFSGAASSGAMMQGDDSMEFVKTVIAVTDERSFVVDSEFDAGVSRVFVYGKEVADMHTINQNHIYTITTAAVKSLDAEVTLLKQQLAEQGEMVRELMAFMTQLKN